MEQKLIKTILNICNFQKWIKLKLIRIDFLSISQTLKISKNRYFDLMINVCWEHELEY